MNNLNKLFESIFAFGSELCVNFFIYGFIGSLIALIWSVVLIRRANKKGKFDRPNKLWSFVAGLSKYYASIICIVMIGTLSGIYGVNSKVNENIALTVHDAIEVLNLDNISITNLQNHLNGQRNIEQALVLELGKSNGDIHANNIIWLLTLLVLLKRNSSLNGRVKP